MRPEITPDFLRSVKDRLADVYGDQLKGVILYGSEARNEAEEDSDVDLLVLLEKPVNFWDDLDKIIDALYPLQLEILRPIQATPVEVEDYETGKYPTLMNAKAEGVEL